MEALDGLPLAKIHCSVLAEEAVAAAINDYRRKQGHEVEISKCEGCCGKCGDNRND